MLEARAEHRPGVRQLENVARAASQLSHKLAPLGAEMFNSQTLVPGLVFLGEKGAAQLR